jgi:hypothetical protein
MEKVTDMLIKRLLECKCLDNEYQKVMFEQICRQKRCRPMRRYIQCILRKHMPNNTFTSLKNMTDEQIGRAIEKAENEVWRKSRCYCRDKCLPVDPCC